MIDKKEAKSAYKLSKKVGAVVAYKNLETNERYIDIAPDLEIGRASCRERV